MKHGRDSVLRFGRDSGTHLPFEVPSSASGSVSFSLLTSQCSEIINSIKLINAGMQADPMQERLRSLTLAMNDSDWKARASAYELAANLPAGEKIALVARVCDNLPKILSEITPLALEKALTLVLAVVNTCYTNSNTGLNWTQVIRALFDKVLSLGRPNLQKISEEIFFKSAERLGWKDSWSIVRECLGHRNPKLQLAALQVLRGSSNSGFVQECVSHLNLLGEKCQDPNPGIRGAAMDFLKHLVTLKGTSILRSLGSLKPIQLNELASYADAGKHDSRSLEGPDIVNNGSKGSAEVESWETQEQVQILAKFPEAWAHKVEQEPNWLDKKKKLEILDAALGFGNRLEPAPYMHIVRLLKKILSETNVPLHMVCISIARKLASGLRNRFSQGFKMLNRCMLLRLRDKKPAVTEAIIQVLKSGTNCVTPEELLEDYREMMKEKNPFTKSVAFKMLSFYVSHPNTKTITPSTIKSLLSLYKEGVMDPSLEVKGAAAELLGCLGKLTTLEPPLIREIAELETKRREQSRTLLQPRPSTLGSGNRSLAPTNSKDSIRFQAGGALSPVLTPSQPLDSDRRVQSAEKPRALSGFSNPRQVLGQKPHSNQGTPTGQKGVMATPIRPSGSERVSGEPRNLSSNSAQNRSPIFKKPGVVLGPSSAKSPFQKQHLQPSQTKKPLSQSEQKLSQLLTSQRTLRPPPTSNFRPQQIVDLEVDSDDMRDGVAIVDDTIPRESMKQEHLEGEAIAKASKVNSEEISTSSMVSVSQLGQAKKPINEPLKHSTRVLDNQPAHTSRFDENTSSEERNRVRSIPQRQDTKPTPALEPLFNIMTELKLDLDVKSAVDTLVKQYGLPVEIFERLTSGTTQPRVQQISILKRLLSERKAAPLLHSVMILLRAATNQFRTDDPIILQAVIEVCGVVANEGEAKSSHLIFELMLVRFESIISKRIEEITPGQIIPNFELLHVLCARLGIRRATVMVLVNLKDKPSSIISETGLIIISHIVHYAITNKSDIRSIPILEIRKFIEGGLSNISPRMRKSSMGLLGWLSESQIEDAMLLQMHNQTELLHKTDYAQILNMIRCQLGVSQNKDSHLELSSETGGSSLNLQMISSGSEMIEEPKPVESETSIAAQDLPLVSRPSAIEISMRAEGIEPTSTEPQRVLRKPLLATNQGQSGPKIVGILTQPVKEVPTQSTVLLEDPAERLTSVTLEGSDRIRLELRDQELCLLKTALKTEYGEVFMNQMFSIEAIKVADALAKIESRLKQKEPSESHTWLHSFLWILYRVSDSCNSELLEQFAATTLRLIHSADRQGKHLRADEAQLLIAIVIRVISNQESPSGVQLFSGTFPYLLLQEHIDIFNSTCVTALSKPGLRSKDRILQLVYLFNKNSKNVMTLNTFFKFVGVLEYLSKSTIKEGCQAIKLCLSLLSVQDEVSVLELVKNQGFSLRMMELWNSMILPKHDEIVQQQAPDKPRTDYTESGVQTEPNQVPARSEVSVDAVCQTRMQEEALPTTLIMPPEPQDTLNQLFSRPLLQLRNEIEEILAAANLVDSADARDPELGPALGWPITAMVLKKIVEVSKIKSVESETFLYSSSALIVLFMSSVLRHSADLSSYSSELHEKTKLGVELLQKVCGILTITSAVNAEGLHNLFLRLAEALAGYSSNIKGAEPKKVEQSEAFFLIRKLLNSALLRLVESDPCNVLKSLLHCCSQVRVGTPVHNILVKSLLQFGQNIPASLQKVTSDKLLDILDAYVVEVTKPIPATMKHTLKSLVHSIWSFASSSTESEIIWQKEGLILEWITHLSKIEAHQESTETDDLTDLQRLDQAKPDSGPIDINMICGNMHIQQLPVLQIQNQPVTSHLVGKFAATIPTEPTDNNVFRNTRSKTKDQQSNSKYMLEEQSRDSDSHVQMHTLGTQTVDSPLPNLLQSLENTFEKPLPGRMGSKPTSSGRRVDLAPADDDVSNISVTPLLAGMTPNQLKAMPASKLRGPISTLDIIEQLSNGVAAVSKYAGESNYILNLADGRQVPSSKIIAPVLAVNSRNSSNKKEPLSKNQFESPQATRLPIIASNSKPAGLNPVLQGMIRSYSQATVTHYRDHAAVIAGYLKRDFPTNTDDNDGIAPYLSDLSPGQRSFLFSHLESSGLKRWIPTNVAQSRYPSSGKKSECSKNKSPSRDAVGGTSISKIFQQLAAINQKLELVKPKPATNGTEESRPRPLGNTGILGLGGSLQFPGSPKDNTTSNQISGSHMMVEDRTECINKLESQIHAVLKRIKPPGPK